MNDNCYYVYEWIRLDTNQPFYVGKGKLDRAYELKNNRNKYFKDVIKNREVAVVILQDNLDEREAFQYECWYIHEYRYEMGIELTNQTDGGDGVSGWFNNLDENRKEQYSKNMTIILNERYENHPEIKEKISQKTKESWNSTEMIEFAKKRGKKRHEENPNFFSCISSEFWQSEEGRAKASKQGKAIWANNEIRERILISRKNSTKFRENVYEANSIRFSNGGNPNAKKIILRINFIEKSFECKKDAINYLNTIGIQLISEKTGKPVKRVNKALFNKKISNKPYIDFNGNIIQIVDE